MPQVTTKADRYNEGKPQISYPLSARYALEGIAKVMEYGAIKYDRDNWKKGLDLNSTLDSLLRHITKLLDGEEVDEESGLPHLDHIACNALFAAYHHNGRKAKHEEENTQNLINSLGFSAQLNLFDTSEPLGCRPSPRISRAGLQRSPLESSI